MTSSIRLGIAYNIWRQMNILITGGAGYIGSVLVDYILSQPWKVAQTGFKVPQVNIRIIDNLMYKQDGLIYFCSLKHKDCFDFIYGDVRDTDFLLKQADWADVVIPLAAIVGMPACERDKCGAGQI